MAVRQRGGKKEEEVKKSVIEKSVRSKEERNKPGGDMQNGR